MNEPEFETKLENLVIKAINDDLDLRGSFAITHPSTEKPNYEILVTEFESNAISP